MKELIGKPLTYKGLCEELDLEYLGGNAKKNQLAQLKEHYDIEVVENPKRYIIRKILNQDADLPNVKSPLQLPFEYAVSLALKENNYDDLYCSNTQLLLLLSLVNSNYKVLKSPRSRAKLEKVTGEDYENLYIAASEAGVVLKKWVDIFMKRMENRGLILYRKGFVLVKEVYIDDSKVPIIQKYNVPLQSDDERRILNCWHSAANIVRLPLFRNDFIPKNYTQDFFNEFNRQIEKEFKGEYTGGFKVNVITCNKIGNQKFIENVRQVLNDKSQKKIKETVALDFLTGAERKRLIDEIIKIPPTTDYRV